MFGSSRLEHISVIFTSGGMGVVVVGGIYLAPQHKDGVDVGEDAVEAEVDVRTDQREDRGQDAGPRLELREESGRDCSLCHSLYNANRCVTVGETHT